MKIDPELLETIAEDLAAEASYSDMLAHPETVVDAFDLFDGPPKPRHSEGLTRQTMCIRCGVQPPSHPKLDHCAACWGLEIDERTAKLRREHPETFVKRRGLRDRRYAG